MAAENGKMRQVGEVIKPMVSEDIVREIILQYFGVEITRIEELDSFDDRNFYVSVQDRYLNPHITELHKHGYVVKILNSMDSRKPIFIEAMNALILHAANNGITTSRPVPSVSGEQTVFLDIPAARSGSKGTTEETKRHAIRLFTFIPGRTLIEVPYTPSLCYMTGKYAGRVDRAFKSFHHPFYDSHVLLWSVDNVPKLRDFVHVVASDTDREMVNEILTAFENEVIPLLGTFQKAMIHGDVNEGNVLVALNEQALPENKPKTDEYHVCGIIDFGHASSSYLLFEVAIAMCYIMVESRVVHPFDAAGHILAGYVSEIELNETERNCLKLCVAGRFCQSLVIGAYSYSLDPGNEYLVKTAKRGWPCLRELWATPTDEIHTRWNGIISSYSTYNKKALIK